LCPAFPEILESSAESATAQRNNGVGSEHCPKHAATLEAIANDSLASRFNDSGGGTEKSGIKFVVAHSVTVCIDNLDCVRSLLFRNVPYPFCTVSKPYAALRMRKTASIGLALDPRRKRAWRLIGVTR
jgi:hypothetical protein